jgi:hypothetical protein
MSALGHKQTFAVQKGMSALPPKADMCDAKRDVRFVPKADIGVSTTFRLTFVGRVRNRLFASIAHIGEMVFQAGLDTAAPRLNIRANLFDVRFTSLPDGSPLYQRKLAAQGKILETRLDARDAALAFVSRALSFYVGSAGFSDALLREYHGRYRGNREKRQSSHKYAQSILRHDGHVLSFGRGVSHGTGNTGFFE